MSHKSVKAYKIVAENDLIELQQSVQAAVEDRWEPHGSVLMDPTRYNRFIQPMIKR